MKSLIVILTKDRPNILQRCIQTIIKNTKNKNLVWLIIDDSNRHHSKQNFSILQKLAVKNNKIYHVTRKIRNNIIKNLENEIGKELGDKTFQKTDTRDISGLRNIGLLCSIILDSETTFLIDDDIVIQKHNNFLDETISRYRKKSDCIIGGNLSGIIDESYFGRVLFWIDKNLFAEWRKKNVFNPNQSESKHPLWLSPEKTKKIIHNKHTSGGMLAFKLDRQSAIPFPFGYNEDWNWCLLQFMIKKTEILHERGVGYHMPPSFYLPSSNGMLWEQKGEIIFESLNQISMKNKKTSFITILNAAKKTNALIETIDEMKQAKASLNEFLTKTHNKNERNEINKEIIKIRKVIKNLEKLTLSNLLDDWFANLEKRQSLFSNIFKRKSLENKILNAIMKSEV